MPAKISDISSFGKKPIRIDLGDIGDLNLTVYPNRLTLSTQDAIQKAVADNDTGGASKVFFTLVADWDVQDDAGETMPLTEESLSMIGLGIIGEIMEQIGEILNPKVKPAKK